MILNNVYIVGGNNRAKAIVIDDKKIEKIINETEIDNYSNRSTINFNNVVCFPGLINSHDHLEFDLFPQLGNKKYQDYVDWGEDIHQQNKNEIKSILAIPLDLRIKFGVYKNFLAGVTTVFHHGKRFNSFNNETIDIKTGGTIIHSVQLENNWKIKLNNFLNFDKVLIHIGEGINKKSKKEIDELLKWNLFKKKLIGIHAISMSSEQAKNFHAIVWCPISNYFLFDETAKTDQLKKSTNILFGTDSTLTGGWNIWEHLRFARNLKLLNDEELFGSITKNPANVFGLKNCGEVKENYIADLVIAKRKNNDLWNAFYSINPEDILLILKKGEIILFDEEILSSLKEINTEKFFRYKTKYVLFDINKSVEELKNTNQKIKIPFC